MTTAAKAKMAMIHMHCERHLNLIADALPKEYALTLLCRHKTMDGASIPPSVATYSRTFEVLNKHRAARGWKVVPKSPPQGAEE